MIWLCLVLIFIAAVCKAFADTLDHHFFTSVFREKPQGFWNPNVIHKTAKEIFGYPIDAWHIANSVQIAAWLAVPLFYEPNIMIMDYVVGGLTFIVVFNLFYNKVFR